MTHPTQTDILGGVPIETFDNLKDRIVDWTLLSESEVAPDILALLATHGRHDYAELGHLLEHGEIDQLDVSWSYRLAKVAALLPDVPNGVAFAEALLSFHLEDLMAGKGKAALLKLLAELRMTLGDWPGARKLINNTRIEHSYHGYLLADVNNPFISDADDEIKWLELFNNPLKESGISRVKLKQGSGVPFNRLSGRTLRPKRKGPLVSVILTVFNPDSADFLAAARSILNQTWQNLELLIVDDCSSEIEPDLLNGLALEDDRVRLIKLRSNGGTYIARNFGILAARGEYVTGQDADDWSHPERINEQMNVILEDPSIIGVDVRSNRMSDSLFRSKLGHGPDRRCEVSLLFRRSDAIALGGYLPIRKAADSEFRLRLEAWSHKEVQQIRKPLYFTRLSAGSLSRSDFRPGWSHQTRRAFFSSFSFWHQNAPEKELAINATEGDMNLSIHGIPQRISGRETRINAEVCFVADWRKPRDDYIQEVLDAAEQHQVAIMHVDAVFATFDEPRRITPHLQALLNCGTLTRIFPDSNSVIDRLVILDPTIVQYTPHAFASLTTQSVSISSSNDSTTFDRNIVTKILKSILGIDPAWR